MGRARLNGQSGSKINGIIEEYIVQAGENISAGDFVEFVSTNLTASVKTTVESSGNSVKLVLLSSTKVLAITRDYYSPGYTFARVLTISGSTITAGNKTAIVSESCSEFEAIALGETKVIIAYARSAENSYYGASRILTISGDTISSGAVVIFKAARPISTSIIKISETSIFVNYCDYSDSNKMKAQILTISGTTITLGAEQTISNANAGDNSVALLSSNKVLLNYLMYINSYWYGYAVVLTISGTTISVGTTNVYDSTGKLLRVDNQLITDSLVLVGAQIGDNSGYTYPYVFTLNVSGSNITKGPQKITGNTYTWNSLTLRLLSPTVAIMAYGDYSSGMKNGRVCIISVDGSGISSVSNELIYDNTGIIDGISIVPLSSSKALVMYSNSDLHTADSRFLTIDNFVKKSLSRRNIHGIAKTRGSAGETVKAFTIAG